MNHLLHFDFSFQSSPRLPQPHPVPPSVMSSPADSSPDKMARPPVLSSHGSPYAATSYRPASDGGKPMPLYPRHTDHLNDQPIATDGDYKESPYGMPGTYLSKDETHDESVVKQGHTQESDLFVGAKENVKSVVDVNASAVKDGKSNVSGSKTIPGLDLVVDNSSVTSSQQETPRTLRSRGSLENNLQSAYSLEKADGGGNQDSNQVIQSLGKIVSQLQALHDVNKNQVGVGAMPQVPSWKKQKEDETARKMAALIENESDSDGEGPITQRQMYRSPPSTLDSREFSGFGSASKYHGESSGQSFIKQGNVKDSVSYSSYDEYSDTSVNRSSYASDARSSRFQEFDDRYSNTEPVQRASISTEYHSQHPVINSDYRPIVNPELRSKPRHSFPSHSSTQSPHDYPLQGTLPPRDTLTPHDDEFPPQEILLPRDPYTHRNPYQDTLPSRDSAPPRDAYSRQESPPPPSRGYARYSPRRDSPDPRYSDPEYPLPCTVLPRDEPAYSDLPSFIPQPTAPPRPYEDENYVPKSRVSYGQDYQVPFGIDKPPPHVIERAVYYQEESYYRDNPPTQEFPVESAYPPMDYHLGNPAPVSIVLANMQSVDYDHGRTMNTYNAGMLKLIVCLV